MPDLCPMRTRSSGIHLSQVISAICADRGIYPEQSPDALPPINLLMLGRAHERALISMWTEHEHEPEHGIYIDPGEVSRDGIIGSPDRLHVGGLWAPVTVIEMKLTYMSSNRADDPQCVEFWRWWAQLMGYCYMMEIPHGELDVTFSMGDYSRGPREDGTSGPNPINRRWGWEFTESQLISNWALMLSYRDRVQPEEH